MFEPIKNKRPFLKMAFQGFAGDGKTYTAIQTAIGLHKMIGSTKPIAILDTEKASKALVRLEKKHGVQFVVNEERSLSALSNAIDWCENGGADILIIDSITHIWEEFLESYKKSKSRNQSYLEFQDWGIIKPRWKKDFSTKYIKAKVHIIFTGRAGYEYEFNESVDSRTGRAKKEIQKSGIKMKAETETAFEPDLLVLMEKHKDLLSENKSISRHAIILKDRTTLIDGKTFVNPTFQHFKPTITELLNGFYEEDKPSLFTDKFEHEDDSEYYERKKKRNVLFAEIKATFELMGIGATKEDKALKSSVMNKLWGFKSAEGLKTLDLEKLQQGVDIINAACEEYSPMLRDWREQGQQPDVNVIYQLVDKHSEEQTPY